MVSGKRTDYGDSKYAGLEVPFPTDGVDRSVNVSESQAHAHTRPPPCR